VTLSNFLRFSLAAAAITLACSAADIPSGWKTIKDRKQVCQVAVPNDWTTDKILTSMATAPDKKANVIVHGLPPSANYAETVATAKKMFQPLKVFDETGSRTWFSSARRNGKPGSSWYVATGGSQVCNAQVDFDDASMEATARRLSNR
jgi:hypothetical protein